MLIWRNSNKDNRSLRKRNLLENQQKHKANFKTFDKTEEISAKSFHKNIAIPFTDDVVCFFRTPGDSL